MEAKTFDWKDVANSQFEKALTLAILVLLFAVLVTPKVDIKRQKFSVQETQVIDLPPEEREKLTPPEDIAKPVIDIIIEDEPTGTDATDPNVLAAIQTQLGLGIFEQNTSGRGSGASERPFEFVPYEDPPEPINPVAPDYPTFAIRTGIEGLVYLEVDVYKDGTIGNIKVLKSLMSGPNGLDEAAINAVRRWKFQPGKSGGKPVDTTVIIPIEFTLNK